MTPSLAEALHAWHDFYMLAGMASAMKTGPLSNQAG